MDILSPGTKVSLYLNNQGLHVKNGHIELSNKASVFTVSYSIHSGSIIKGNTVVLLHKDSMVLSGSGNNLSLIKCNNPRSYNSACSVTLLKNNNDMYNLIIDAYLVITPNTSNASGFIVGGFVNNNLKVYATTYQNEAANFIIKIHKPIVMEEISQRTTIDFLPGISDNNNNFEISHHRDYYKYVPMEEYQMLKQKYDELNSNLKQGKWKNKCSIQEEITKRKILPYVPMEEYQMLQQKYDELKQGKRTHVSSYVPTSDLERYKNHVIQKYLKEHGLANNLPVKNTDTELDRYKRRLVTDYIINHPNIVNNCSGCNINEHPDIHRYILKSQIPQLLNQAKDSNDKQNTNCIKHFK